MAIAGTVATKLYLIEILHQTTTCSQLLRLFAGCILSKFYIKPQQRIRHKIGHSCCILSKFYIKPQPYCYRAEYDGVVSYRNSTSNHNSDFDKGEKFNVVSYRNSTSNHNSYRFSVGAYRVVSYRNSTSNHNSVIACAPRFELYLIEILHQTTTADSP